MQKKIEPQKKSGTKKGGRPRGGVQGRNGERVRVCKGRMGRGRGRGRAVNGPAVKGFPLAFSFGY